MEPGLIAVLILFFLALLGFLLSRKNASKAKNYGARAYCIATHMYGIPGIPQKYPADLYFTDEKIIIEAKKNIFELHYSQITAAEGVHKSDILVKDKSVVARGLTGGLLLGPVGAIVGGMSGVGQKNIKGEFLILNFRSSGESEPKVVIFDINNISKARKLAEFVKYKSQIGTGPITL